MSSKLQGIVSEIKGLSVLEVAELVNLLQDEFGVTAAAAAAPAAGASAGAAAAEEKTSFKVELTDVAEDKKIKVIKALRSVKKELGLMDAKNATQNLPYVIYEEANKEDSENAKKVLEEAGAKVKLS